MSKQPLIDQLDRAIAELLADTGAAPASVDAEMNASIVELLRIAQDLRGFPAPEFRASLKADLERKAQMSTRTVELRPGFRTVTPYLLPPGPQYIDFLKNVFGAVETERTPIAPGRFHAE